MLGGVEKWGREEVKKPRALNPKENQIKMEECEEESHSKWSNFTA